MRTDKIRAIWAGDDEPGAPPDKQFMLNFVEIEPCMWIKVYMTAGINPMCAGADPVTPTCVQHTFALPFHAFCRLFTLGAHCVTPAVRHVPPQVLTGRINAAETGNGRPGSAGAPEGIGLCRPA